MGQEVKKHLPIVRTDSSICPGLIRAATDSEYAAVGAFLRRHPEYSRFSHIELVTLAATYRDDDDRAVRDALADEGVPMDWHRPEENF